MRRILSGSARRHALYPFQVCERWAGPSGPAGWDDLKVVPYERPYTRSCLPSASTTRSSLTTFWPFEN
jgi:hypothetical protein